MPPNTRVNVPKRFHRTRYNRYFGEDVQDCEDGSRLQFIKINFLDRMFRNQSCRSGEISNLLVVIFFLIGNISLLPPVFTFFFSYCNPISASYGPYLIKYDISGVTVSL